MRARTAPRFTLVVTVVSLFLTVALLVGAAVTVTNYIEARRTALKVAGDTFRATISQINERRLAFFAPAFMVTDIFPNAPALQRSDGPREATVQLILSSLRCRLYLFEIMLGQPIIESDASPPCGPVYN